MPRKIQDFAQQSLVKPVLVNVGRAGAANLDVLQVVEYVKQEAKMVYLLECLQKTPPPVIIFSENKNEVDGEGYKTYLSTSLLISFCCRHSRVPPSQGRRSCGYPRFQKYTFPHTNIAALSDICHQARKNANTPSNLSNPVLKM